MLAHPQRLSFQAGLILLLTATVAMSAEASPKRASTPQPALARIEKIVIDGTVVSRPSIDQVKVVRASGSELPGEIGLSLYADDRVITGAAKIVLSPSNGANNRNKGVTLGENTSLVILQQSVFLTLGRIWVNVTGFFSVRTRYWLLGVPGTEFFFEVTPASEGSRAKTPVKANLSVIEGAVDVTLLNNESSTPRIQNISMQDAAKPAQGGSLRVKASEEVDLVAGRALPPKPRPLSPERISYLKRVIALVESASGNPTPSGWKTATGAGLTFNVPENFRVTSDIMPGHLSDGTSTQTFQLHYLTAADFNSYIFASAGYGYVQISPLYRKSMEELASESVSKILGTLNIPGVGALRLDLNNAEVSPLKTMGLQVSETTGTSLVTGRKYRVFFALAFRRSTDGRVKMVHIVTGSPEDGAGDVYDMLASILSSFKVSDIDEPDTGAGIGQGSRSAARDVVNKMVAEDFEGVRAHFNEQMKQGLSAEQMRQVWTAAIQYHGRYRSQGEAVQSQQQGYDVYTIKCEMERSPMEVVVAYDQSGKIGGLWIRPAQF